MGPAEAPYESEARKGKSDVARRSVPPTPRASNILLRRKKEAKLSPYVFPAEGISGHIVFVQHPHENAIKDAKLETFGVLAIFAAIGWSTGRCAGQLIEKIGGQCRTRTCDLLLVSTGMAQAN